MQGTCSIRFHPDRTVFEMSCALPAPALLDEALLDTAQLSSHVWAVGVEDSPQQRRVLQVGTRQ
jgi:hypothetical protein